MKNPWQATAQARNPLSEKRHKSEVFWQIIFPLILGVIILLIVAIFSAGMGPNDTRRWADISAIWLITMLMAGVFIWLITLVASIYLVQLIIQVLPGQSYRLLVVLFQIQANLERIGNRAAEPVFKINAFAASLQKLLRPHSSGRHNKLKP